MPKPLIPLLDDYQAPAVSARELYKFLGLAPQHYARWSLKNLTDNPFAAQGQDWSPLEPTLHDGECSGINTYNYAQDYSLSLDFAKRLAMMARSERGEQARRYFLDCERVARQALESPAPTALVAPPSYPAALRALADAEERRMEAELRVALLEPKAALFERAMDSAGFLDMTEVSRVLSLPYSNVTLFRKLRSAGVIMADTTIPYQRWMEASPPYFKVVKTPFTDGHGRTHLNLKTLVTQRGLEFIDRKLGELGG